MINFDKESQLYEKSLDVNYKKSNGVFYTDLNLAQLIMNEIEFKHPDVRVIDPCCGTGVFVKIAVDKGLNNVYGIDLDKTAISLAKKMCPSANLKSMDSISNDFNEIMKKFKIKEKFDYVIGNPPYVPLTSASLKTQEYLFLRQVKNYGDNLYIAALLRAKEMLNDDGIISYIIPKNFLHVDSYSFLRRELLRDFSIISIVDIGMYFKKVRGEQIVLTLQKKKNANNVIKLKKLINNKFEFLTEIRQDFYTDKIIIFENKEDVEIYRKFNKSYTTLNDYVNGYVGRGHSQSSNAICGKDIRKFGLKSLPQQEDGSQIFIQNIYSAEAGIIACFGGKLEANETVTIFTDGDSTMCRYVLGIIHSKLINFYLLKYCYNNSSVTMHVDAKYLRSIPFIVDNENFNIVLEYVDKLESLDYMSNEWFEYCNLLNRIVYRIYNLSEKEINFIDAFIKKTQSKKWDRNGK
ncbi:MAG: N-6 DNA methylase [Clostridia bacterium]|nr:N-6 DNA methylase [Clostridia bacterium]